MDDDYTISFKGDYIRVDVIGPRSLDNSTALWTEIIESCRENNCYTVLGISDGPGPMPICDAYDHASLFRELDIGPRFRIAFAELNDEARPNEFFIETVLNNRGLPGRVFATEKEAREWLFPETEDTAS